MDLITAVPNPWGEWVFTHVSWRLFWASLSGGVLFMLAHVGYMRFSRHPERPAAEIDRLVREHADLPERVVRHGLVARLVHWVMAVAMLTLLLTAFLPITGVRIAWVTWHWQAGLLLTASVLFHVVHATVALDFRSIWVGPKDIAAMGRALARRRGATGRRGGRVRSGGDKTGKYPLGNRLYHLAVTVCGLLAIGSGLLMMKRVRTGILERDPHVLSDAAWGVTYVMHGLVGIGFVGLVIAHIYFALRPEKRWITRSMLMGTISRREYLMHHDPKLWSPRHER